MNLHQATEPLTGFDLYAPDMREGKFSDVQFFLMASWRVVFAVFFFGGNCFGLWVSNMHGAYLVCFIVCRCFT